jgi:hypothetical protein
MGTWGSGLYSNDAAADLKSAITTVLRLPLRPDELVAALREQEPALDDPGSEDYTACWFAVADRFHRYGIDHPATTALVRKLIEDRTDLKLNAQLGMSAKDLQRREKVLDDLAARLSRPDPKPVSRAGLKNPKKFILDIGDIVMLPMMGARSANSYFKAWTAEHPPFEPDRIGVAVVLDRGHTFGYLAWYTIAMLDESWTDEPAIAQCLAAPLRPADSGTLSPTHFKRMALRKIGAVPLNSAVDALRPPRRRSDYTAISDIGLTNVLNLRPSRAEAPGRPLREFVER